MERLNSCIRFVGVALNVAVSGEASDELLVEACLSKESDGRD